ncbi:glycerate dehydrogenase [Prevotella denticola DNF00960]|uniref:D-2-hydroxyacid dehydrogenase n=1 Tax=Prevotella denticola TaxID=28129 RepID=UPI00050D9290|nr:D-2-hydroxyacid dehydrogenase [Prevotella denticola]KGF43180.1 glycerate dehydrogenase [Prevotella denticola DNF00960]
MKISILDCHAVNPGDLSWEPVKSLADCTIYDHTCQEQVAERAREADGILINKVYITREVLDELPRLKYIGELATGYNNIDLEAARERGIVVCNIPAYSTDSVAQHVFALLLNVATRADHYARAVRQGEWSRQRDFCYWDTPLIELAGKTIGIVGLGNIGQRVAHIAHAMGMDISACTSRNSSDLPEWIRKTTLEGLLSTSDVITLHCPLTTGNTRMINAGPLAMVHPGAILINTGRGGLVDEQAVAAALESGQLAAYCADVLTDEPPRPDNPLFRQPNAYITPHIAWATREARQRLMAVCVENIRRFIAGNPQNVV